MCREMPPGHVFVESLAEIDPRKIAEVVRRTLLTDYLKSCNSLRGLFSHAAQNEPKNLQSCKTETKTETEIRQSYRSCRICSVRFIFSSQVSFSSRMSFSVISSLSMASSPLSIVSDVVRRRRFSEDESASSSSCENWGPRRAAAVPVVENTNNSVISLCNQTDSEPPAVAR